MKKVVKCQNCGNKAPQKILNEYSASDQILITLPGEQTPDWENLVEYIFFIVSCGSCKCISIFRFAIIDQDEDELLALLSDLGNADILVPKKILDFAIPANIRSFYKEAEAVKKISPASFVTMVARTLEATFLDQGIVKSGQTLGRQIHDLKEKKDLPEKLIELCNKINFFRIKGAHAYAYNIEPQEVEAVEDFLLLLLEYIYVIPNKIKVLEELIQKKNSI